MRTMMWFRRDLRVRDNTALWTAAQEATRGVVGVYLLSPLQWREHDDAPCKVDFWIRNLRTLEVALAERGIPLLVREAPRFSDAPEVLLGVARECGCDALHLNREYEVNERRRDEEVARRFVEAGLRVRSHTDRVLLEPGEVLTREGSHYRVFGPFRKRWLEVAGERGVEVRPLPKRRDGFAGLRTRGEASSRGTPSQVPDRVEGLEGGQVDPALWPAGEKAATDRLDAFVREGIERYADRRDLPAEAGTSRLSPYLAAGVVSPRQCLAAAMEVNDGRLGEGRPGSVAWIGELVWREFYQHILVGYPRVSMGRPFRPETTALPRRTDEAHFAAWCEGRTGYPIVDAGMRQLRRTGWMHNRLRMITAMFLSKHLLLDWRRGERFFMRHLIDGDLGANNGGWQWASSTGTDAAPYFRIFNPTTQSRRFDPQGTFLRRYLPELSELDSDAIHDPGGVPGLPRRGLDYPDPIVDHAQARERAIRAFRALPGISGG